ncbi:MAG: tRNA (guanosine(46)-N7)-methyltransferase TrmB [Treponema sp.]|jgi:tRNA (guanine-N7-)-methyltransferase|nr:tRNA (guanosine(46)-N7)-methyltransferase TrmB [Treponema sp.]
MAEEEEAVPGPLRDRRIKSYVLRAGRISGAQLRAWETLAPVYCLPFEPRPLDTAAAFGKSRPLFIEIGFGMGIATALIAEQNPGKNYLGLEVYRPGVGRLLWEIGRRGLKNIRVIEHDAVEVLEKMIPPASVEGFHIFFPDPWPKKRHHKRRLITRPFTGVLAEKLRPGAYIYMVTDWENYADWALAELSATPGLFNPHGGFAPPREWRPKTKFEEKGLAKDHAVRELFFVKK